MKPAWICPLSFALLTACTGATPTDSAADASSDATLVDHRGARYCEILIGKIATDNVHVDVYSTEGLNDCPDATWITQDPAALKTQFAADLVILNGPRYWMLDSLAGSALQDTTVVTLGGVAMRKAGMIDLPAADLVAMSKPYQQHTIHRDSAFHFWANQPVFELLDPALRLLNACLRSTYADPDLFEPLSKLLQVLREQDELTFTMTLLRESSSELVAPLES